MWWAAKKSEYPCWRRPFVLTRCFQMYIVDGSVSATTVQGRYRDAATALRTARLEGWGYAWLAASFSRIGEAERAREALERFRTKRREELEATGAPADSTKDLLGNYQNNFRHHAEWEHFLDGLRKAGLEF